jgi:hypothetical protein
MVTKDEKVFVKHDRTVLKQVCIFGECQVSQDVNNCSSRSRLPSDALPRSSNILHSQSPLQQTKLFGRWATRASDTFSQAEWKKPFASTAFLVVVSDRLQTKICQGCREQKPRRPSLAMAMAVLDEQQVVSPS